MALLCGALNSGCGFTPVYQTQKGQSSPQSFRLTVTGANDQAYTSYKVRRELETLLPTIPAFKKNPISIKVTLSEQYGDIAYSSNAQTLRGQGQLRAHVELFDQMLEPFYVTDIDTVSSYTIDYPEEFATISAESGARERLIKALARDIAHDIAYFLS